MKPKFAQYNTNIKSNTAPFRFNRDFDLSESNEANTYLNVWSEACFLFGSKVSYIEREVNSAEPIFGEYLESKLILATEMYMMLEELAAGAFGGNGDMYAKFGLQVTDESTFTCPITTFSQAKINPAHALDPTVPEFLPFYPKVSDLIYFHNAKKLFEIQHIEQEVSPSMYAFGNRNGYSIKTRLYTYTHEEIATNMDANMPLEIQSLNSINIQDITNYNTPIQTSVSGVIDNTEVDPLA